MTIQIELTNVDKHYGDFHALKSINLAIEQGKFVALVGPSGCGKSTLLRSLAGLETISGGTMRIGGETMNGVPPRQRDVAMVFQSYALYPHMSVLDNLTYSMRLKRRPKRDIESAANEVATTIGLEKLLKRYPRELSGGQRQRVAMGRAIIRHPKAFLFDEPLSNLDAALRVHMRKEIRALHDRLKATSVYVTHDQIEAMTMADHIVVLKDGVIEQQGSPLALYDHPANTFVAGFIGSPAMNFVGGHVDATGRSIALDLAGRPLLDAARTLDPGREVIVGLRPEFISIVPEAEAEIVLPVAAVEPTGATTYVTLAGDPDLTVVINGRTDVQRCERVGLAIAPEKLHIFDAEGERVA